MKAAIIYPGNEVPEFAEFPEPVVHNDEEILMTVKTVALKQVDRARALGKHYSIQKDLKLAHVIGSDGVGLLEDGTRVYAIGTGGMAAEKAVIEKSRMIPLPAIIDDASAAALPNTVIGSAMALLFRAGMKKGETILINGATGFTGRIAVQVAKYYGAGRILPSASQKNS